MPSMIWLHPRLLAKNEFHERSDRTGSLSMLNDLRMNRLWQKYAGVLNLSLFNQPQNDQTMVYSCRWHCNGWGDRLRAVISVYILALLTRRRFMIDMEIPCPLIRFLQPNIVNWTFTAPDLTLGKNRSRLLISAMDYDVASYRQFKSDVASSNFISAWESYDDVWISTNFIGVEKALRNPRVNSRWLIGRLPWAMTKDSWFFPLLFELLFKPTKILTDAAERILRLSYRRLICVHVRIGRNPSNPYDYVLPRRQNITGTMIAFLDKKLSEVGANGTRILVASDSDAAIAEIRQRFPDAVVTVPGPIIHVDQTQSASKRSFDEQKRCEGFLKALTEFVLLGECNVSILSQSGFSISASLRSVKADHEVYLYDDTMQSIGRAQL